MTMDKCISIVANIVTECIVIAQSFVNTRPRTYNGCLHIHCDTITSHNL